MSKVNISEIGQLDVISGQLNVTTAGAGEINRVQIPPSKPPGNRFFILESASLLISDDNGNGTISDPFARNTGATALPVGFIVGEAQPQNPNGLFGVAPPVWALQSLGAGVSFQQVFRQQGAGASLSMFVLISTRRIIIPAGYVFGVYIVDPGDATQHVVAATLIAQGRWFSLDCECP